MVTNYFYHIISFLFFLFFFICCCWFNFYLYKQIQLQNPNQGIFCDFLWKCRHLKLPAFWTIQRSSIGLGKSRKMFWLISISFIRSSRPVRLFSLSLLIFNIYCNLLLFSLYILILMFDLNFICIFFFVKVVLINFSCILLFN